MGQKARPHMKHIVGPQRRAVCFSLTDLIVYYVYIAQLNLGPCSVHSANVCGYCCSVSEHVKATVYTVDIDVNR